MKFSEDFYWGGAVAANQCEVLGTWMDVEWHVQM